VKKGFVIAIDGPLASGKGTIAKKLAQVLHGVDLYTGAMYRCVAYYCSTKGIDLHNDQEVIAQLGKIVISFEGDEVFLNGDTVTEAIHTAAIAEGASVVGSIPEVRKNLVMRQQEIGLAEMQHGKIIIVEGRDIGTVVFPDAALKIYLTASETVRAKRRLAQYQRRGDTRTFESVLDQIKTRDTRDKEREVDPLTSDPESLGYVILDNSEMNEAQTIKSILVELRKRKIL